VFEFIFFLVKFVYCISFIILLSSTTKMHDMLEGGRRMGLPPEFALALGMMIRYLFVFGYMYRKIQETLRTKCFDPFDSRLPYRYRLNQIGYAIGTMFIRSYEQGERVYTASSAGDRERLYLHTEETTRHAELDPPLFHGIHHAYHSSSGSLPRRLIRST
jgi:energy-coupling factor transporter transmembrane protein EcfT